MEHRPVLLEESIEGLRIRPDGIYVDGTLGRGGHSREIARRLGKGRLISIDRDSEAIKEAGAELSGMTDRITIVQGNFSDVAEILSELGIERVDGMLFDFGTSSPQLDDKNRGFSYMQDAKLDMRLQTDGVLTAHEIINSWPEDELRRILYEYGEERYGGSIARAIVRKREEAEINTTFELNNIILSAMPPSARKERQHPSKRSYQAIRIAVNDELGAISRMLDVAPDRLNVGGRLSIISFHSLEDRLVKNAFKSRERGCTCRPDFPKCICGFKQTLKTITKKPVIPGDEELKQNPRARSAKLRVAERV